MSRSPLTESFFRVQSIIDQIHALPDDEYGHLMDRIAPLPEQPEAPTKKARKKRASKGNSGMARATAESITRSRKAVENKDASQGGDLDSPETCVRCPNPIDDNIHHKSTVEGYHEFKSAA